MNPPFSYYHAGIFFNICLRQFQKVVCFSSRKSHRGLISHVVCCANFKKVFLSRKSHSPLMTWEAPQGEKLITNRGQMSDTTVTVQHFFCSVFGFTKCSPNKSNFFYSTKKMTTNRTIKADLFMKQQPDLSTVQQSLASMNSVIRFPDM